MYNEISEVPKGYRKGLFDISDMNEMKPQVVQDRNVISVSREEVMRLVKCLHDVYAELDRENLLCREKAMRSIAVSALSPNTTRNIITRYFFKWRKWLDQRNWEHQGEFVQGELEKCVWCQELISTFQLIQRRLGLELALRHQQDSILVDQQESLHSEHLAVNNITKYCRNAEGRLNAAMGIIHTILASGKQQEEYSVKELKVLHNCEEKKSHEKLNTVRTPLRNFYEMESECNNRVLLQRELRCGTRLFSNINIQQQQQQQQERETLKQWISLTTNTGFGGMDLPSFNALAHNSVLPDKTLS